MSCSGDCWTWSSWACDVYISAWHILLYYADVDVLYSDTTAAFTVVVKACHIAHFYMVYGVYLGMCS